MTRQSMKKSKVNVSHGNRAKVTIELESSDDEPAFPPSPITPTVSKKQKKPKKPKKKTPTHFQITVDTPEEFSQDELAVEQQIIPQPARTRSSPAAAKEKRLIEALEKAATIFSSLGGPADIERLLQRAASRDDDASNKIKNLSADIVALLSSSGPAFAEQVHGEVPSTIAFYDQYFTHLGPGKKMYVLKPVEVFHGNQNLTRKKVAGFIQNRGSSYPLKYALPGWKSCSDDHPMLLDGELWAHEVQRWGSFHNHRFRSHPFDAYHGKPNGASGASHVEPRLMLWFACDKLRQLHGIDGPIQFMLGSLFRLRDYDLKIEAEIFLTRPPCKKCLEIKDLIEEYTKIKFFFKTAQNLGELHAEKDKQGWMSFGRYAQVSDDDNGNDDDDDDEDEVVERHKIIEKTKKIKSTFAVVIRGQPNTPPKQTSKPNCQELTPPSTQTSTVTKTSKMTQKNRISSFTYQPSRSLTTTGRHQAEVETDSDTSDYRPSANTARKRKSTSNLSESPDLDDDPQGITEPDVGPFGHEAQRQAKFLKKERKRKIGDNVSPSLHKKARHTKN